MHPQATPTIHPVHRTAAVTEVVLDCPDCLDSRTFVSPVGPDVVAAERVCVDCGAAVVLLEPVAAPSAPQTLRRVA